MRDQPPTIQPAGDKNQRGNVFFALFGAVAVMGVLGAGVMSFMKGPLQSSVKVTRQNTAENQMVIAAQLAVLQASSQPSGGDCDADGTVEPWPDRDPSPASGPTGGGYIPNELAVTKTDPWSSDYGYCSWDHGTQIDLAGCGGASQRRSRGANSTAYPVIAIISAGADKTFQTTCRDFNVADANSDGDLNDVGDSPLVSKAAGSDDVILQYTYQEATGASGGLWALKSADPNTAYISKNIESLDVTSTGTGSFLAVSTAGIQSSNPKLNINTPMNLVAYNDAGRPACNGAAEGALIINNQAAPGKWQRCVSGTWSDIGGSGGGSAAGSTGSVQYRDSGGAFAGGTTLVWDSATNRLGVNKAVPVYTLDVVGSGYFTNNVQVGGDIRFSGSVTDVSDRRLKENIQKLSGSQLDRLVSLDGYRFSMKDDPRHRIEYGLMAQDVEKVYPELVIEDTYKDQKIKTLSVQGLVAPMIEAMKELKAENDALKARLDRLEKAQAN